MPYKDISYLVDKDVNDFYRKLEELVRQNKESAEALKQIARDVTNGLRLRNHDFIVLNLSSDVGSWKAIATTKLKEFASVWSEIYGGDQSKRVNPYLSSFKVRLKVLSAQIVLIASSCPPSISIDLRDALLDAAAKMSELGHCRFWADGGESASRFDESGNSLTETVMELVQGLENK